MNGPSMHVRPEELSDNPFKLIGSDWMLITAGTKKSFNMMTASWGGFGVIWHKNICWCTIRPQRHTYTFMEKHDYFTLSFFEDQYRNVLEFCGSRSGKTVNKAQEANLTPLETKKGNMYFAEARLVIEARKLYFQDILPENAVDNSLLKNYPKKDYHRMYLGEIIDILKRS